MQGEKAPFIQFVPKNTITKVAQDSSILAMCLQMSKLPVTQPQLHPKMARLSDCYEDLFAKPSQLPSQEQLTIRSL